MTIYVDADPHLFRGKRFHYLFVDERGGDNIMELTRFVHRNFNMPHQWLRESAGWRYFEIHESMYRKAVKRGAVPVGSHRVFAIAHGREALLKSLGLPT